jgi:hypothetical protein
MAESQLTCVSLNIKTGEVLKRKVLGSAGAVDWTPLVKELYEEIEEKGGTSCPA